MINENNVNTKIQYVNHEARKRSHYSPENTKTNYFDSNKNNNSIDTELSNKSFSIADRQVTNKAKNILRTNFLSKYKNSPYIKT